MNNRRIDLLKRVASKRQDDIAILLENVHDVHNLGAVVRSCDAVGVKEIHILQTDKRLHKKKIKLGKRTSSGARKWVDVYLYYRIDICIKTLRSKYDLILSSHVDKESTELYELDLTKSLVLCFGNEKAGISSELIEASDGTFYIPQTGFVQSLNISVACAVTLYEMFRQRKVSGTLSSNNSEALYAEYLKRHKERSQGEIIVID